MVFFWHSQRIKDEVLLVEEVVVGVVYVYVKKERKKNKLEKVEERIHRNKKKKEWKNIGLKHSGQASCNSRFIDFCTHKTLYWIYLLFCPPF